MASSTSQAKFSLKLVVHKEKNRVIFAEANSDFVDTLFSIMTLPMATIIRLLKKIPDENCKVLGSLNNLYNSLVKLPKNLFSSEESQWMLLNPRTTSHDHYKKLKLNIDDTEATKFYVCRDRDCSQRAARSRYISSPYYSTCRYARCGYCGNSMDRQIRYEDSADNIGRHSFDAGVFVSDGATFIVTDELRVMSNTPGCSLNLLCDSGITDASQLENKNFDIGFDQVLMLLKGALLCTNPLTYLVFPNTHHNQESVNPIQGVFVKPFNSNNAPKYMMLKVSLQKSTSKFLFAEADCGFVDFVFGFLEIPLGTLVGKLAEGSGAFQSLINLYASIKNMWSTIGQDIKSHDFRKMLLEPQLMHTYVSENQIYSFSVLNFDNIYLYNDDSKLCSARSYVTRYKLDEYRNKDEKLTCAMKFKDPRVHRRFFKESAKFMLTDDLNITLISSTSTIAMLNKLNVPLDDVEEHQVTIGITEGLNILEASMKSLTLTDALLKTIIETKNSATV